MKRRRLLLLALGLAFAWPPTGFGEKHVVVITPSFTFSPAAITVLKGDSVTWTNASVFLHTTTSGTAPAPNGIWNSGNMAGGAVFSHTFTNAGAFPYYCAIHYLSGMVGSVVVVDTVADASITAAGYVAPTVTVVRGDFVRWTNTSSAAHAVTSGTRPTPDGIWNSGSIALGGVFSRQFNTAGAFPYFDGLNSTNPAYVGLVSVIDATAFAFTGISQSPASGMALQWASADTRKYDLLFKPDLLSTGGFRMAQANIRASGAGVNVLTHLPFLADSLDPANTNLFYRLRILPDNIPALPVALDVIASNFVAPVALQEPADGSRRLFVADQIGRIMIIDSNRTVLPAPFLDLSGVISNLAAIPFIGGVTNSGLNPIYDERGLQGLAFDPGFTTNRRFFVYYNSPKTGTNIDCEGILAAYQVSVTNANLADTNGTVIFRVDKPEFNHNGGCVTFGPDGYLYLPLGDGGGGGDIHGVIGNGQDTNSFLGKILRLDVSSGTHYTIPPDNPFVGTGGLAEVYASGFRHPWRISFDRGMSNRLVAADVGQDLWEEIDFVQKGSNYGWRIMEGNHAFDFSVARTQGLDVAKLAYPIHEYGHGPLGIAAIGGGVYRGTNYPALAGAYIFGDFSTDFGVPDGHLYYLAETRSNIWERFAFVLAPGNAPLGRYVKSFGEDQAGELYLLSTGNLGPSGTSGDIRKLRKP